MALTVRSREALEALFAPKSVAVIGASTRPDSLGRAVFKNIIFHSYTGVVYPVNPKAPSILGIKAYPSVLELPDEIDLAVIIVPAAVVAKVLEECGQKGVKAAIVISAGFKEIGGEGAQRELELKAIAQRYGISLLGPNCFGLMNTDPEVSLNATFAPSMPQRGNIAFISQSGALGVAALEYAQQQKIGLSKFISIGNKADLNENDLLEYLKDDPQTDVILLYLEDLADPKGFHDLAREITGERGKKIPILAIKSGRTLEGAKAASSHTGALAGSDEVYDSLFIQSGVLRVGTIEELFDYAVAFSRQPLPRGDRIAIISNSGGTAILATDTAVRFGLRLAQFSPETKRRLHEFLPPQASMENPIDMIADADEHRYGATLRAMLEDPEVDGVLVLTLPHPLIDLRRIAQKICEVAEEFRAQKPVLACIISLTDVRPVLEILDAGGVPHYEFPEEGARALAAMARYAEWIKRPRTGFKLFEVDKQAVEEVITSAKHEGRSFLTEPEAYAILKAYGFPIPKAKLAHNPEEALSIAEEIGYPVALKIVSPDIVHKVDVGGVRLDIEDEDELRWAYQEMFERIKALRPEAKLWGVLVAEMLSGGIETILGLKRDPHFGPLLMFGLGGIYVEALKDVTFRIAPIRELAAYHMIQQIRGYRILEGYRDKPPADIDSIAECLERLSQLAVDFEEIQELDINPLLVFDKGRGTRVVDARIFVKLG